MLIRDLLFVGLGGAAGSMLRFLTAAMTARFFTGSFPLATLLVNIAGCLLLGILASRFSVDAAADHHLRLLLITGFCGGFTTFSAFSYETILLWNTNSFMAVLYVLASVAGGTIAVWAGWQLSH